MKKNTYIILLFIACIISSILVLPYALNLQNKSIYNLRSLDWLLIIVQNLILYGTIVPVGVYFSKKIDINLVLLEGKTYLVKHLAKNMKYIFGLGISLSLFILIFDLLIFKTPLNIKVNPLFGFLASFYGGINEEVINRLFLTSLLVFLFNKVFKNKITSMCVSITITSVIFGILHLFITAALIPLTFLIITRAILLNGVPGFTFGWLYWKKSFEVAILTHFFVDICLHVLMPIFKSI